MKSKLSYIEIATIFDRWVDGWNLKIADDEDLTSWNDVLEDFKDDLRNKIKEKDEENGKKV